ncbi:hypothetical protein, partial [Vibrio sp. F13]|uniref:hypothetical protein n=1 Tax=Vibrio sp. F13 TaxID=2070777 RepID=UPI0019D21C2C
MLCLQCSALKSKILSYLSSQSLKRNAHFFWQMLVTRASIGCLFLTVFFALNGNMLKGIEITLHIMADTAKLGPAPD